jgi:hypothetical protein
VPCGPRAARRLPLVPPADERDGGSGDRPLYKKWGFWAGVGVAVVGVSVGMMLMNRDSDEEPECMGDGCVDFRP